MLLLFSYPVSASIQSIRVRGKLLCGQEPLIGAEVNLWLLRTPSRPDKEVATMESDDDGFFQMTYHQSDESLSSTQPAVRIYHRCNILGIFKISRRCLRESTHNIPTSYILNYGMVDHWYEMGSLNLESKQPFEQMYCPANSMRPIGD
ncbi:hypothetical protein PMAYCL1PPCAC_05072 [Pristionchus mayeri]|uniref:Transthyretin-like family protein n=1 Tax=Pristionchus mayeri TaxID=1317129 RepID=A0AAN5C9K5_9BILA|nr:hypothetical protein PMAYCL1PPCAC_05072 [Pristionchus mayeri]